MKRQLNMLTLLALLLVAAGTVKAQQVVDGWKKIQTGAPGALYDVCCLDAENILVCGQGGVILKSTDGGETWNLKHTEEGYEITTLEFADAFVGYACGYKTGADGVVLKTTDAGETWAAVSALWLADDPNRELIPVDADTLYVFENGLAGTTPALYKSTDGGQSFDVVVLPFESGLELSQAEGKACYFNENEGYFLFSYMTSGEMGYDQPNLCAFRTTDYGRIWTRHHLLTEEVSYNAAFENARLHVFNKSEARLFYSRGYFDTHDGFSTPPVEVNTVYEDGTVYGQYYGSEDYPFDIKFTDDRCGLYVSNIFWMPDAAVYGGAHLTKDGGEHWEGLTQGMDSGVKYAVDGVDTTFYVTSDGGVVYKRSKVTLWSVEETPVGVTLSPTLTDGKIDIAGAWLREAKVYNALGQCVLTNNGAGDRMTIDLGSHPAGIYFVRITDRDGHRYVKKVVKR